MAQTVKAVPIDLAPETRTADAVRQIMAACLLHVTGNTAMLGAMDGEAVHQTRVGLRRTRSALVLFKRQIAKTTRQHLNNELRALAATLGPSRDLDVFLTSTLPKAAKQLAMEDRSQCDQVRSRAITKQLDVAHPNSAMHMVWSLLSEAIGGIDLRGDELDDPIVDIAPDLLAAQARRVKRRLRHIDTPDERHKLRKTIKKLRYGVEFFSEFYPHKAVKAYLDCCKGVQEVLGDMNDLRTMILLCEEFHGTDDLPVSSLIEWAEHQEVRAKHHLAASVTAFRTAKPFWH
jgi:CHAD domain-containing protein